MPIRRLYIICILAIYPINNENFIRYSFYALVSRYLSSSYTFTIEQNNSAGHSDFEMMRIPDMDYYTDDLDTANRDVKDLVAKGILAPV